MTFATPFARVLTPLTLLAIAATTGAVHCWGALAYTPYNDAVPYTEDRECEALTLGGPDELEVVAPTATSDRVLTALTTCDDGEYEAAPPIREDGFVDIEAGDRLRTTVSCQAAKQTCDARVQINWNDIEDNLAGRFVYMKGAFFYRAVAEQIGSEQLDAVFGVFVQRYLGQAVGMGEMVDLIEEESGEDIGPLVEAWLKSEDVPQ